MKAPAYLFTCTLIGVMAGLGGMGGIVIWLAGMAVIGMAYLYRLTGEYDDFRADVKRVAESMKDDLAQTRPIR